MSDLEQALAYFGAHFDGAAKTNRMGMVLQDEVLRLRAECKETRQERDAYCDELHKVRAELAQYATGRTMSCASCNEVVKELAQVEAESQVIIDRYNSCKAELAELKSSPMLKGLCQMKARAEKAESELAELKEQRRESNGWKKPLGLAKMPCEICGEVGAHLQEAHKYFHSGIKFWADRAEKAESDLAAAKAELADDYGKAKMFFVEAEQLRRNVGELESDLSQARAECAKMRKALKAIAEDYPVMVDSVCNMHHSAMAADALKGAGR